MDPEVIKSSAEALANSVASDPAGYALRSHIKELALLNLVCVGYINTLETRIKALEQSDRLHHTPTSTLRS